MDVGTPTSMSPPTHKCHAPGYAELHAHSDHSLLDGVPSPEALVARAAELDMPAIALTDHDALYGAVRFALAARAAGIKPILGAELTLTGEGAADGAHLTLLVETPQGYANLCRLITLARQGRRKGIARLEKHHLAEHAGGLIALSGCRQGEIPRLLAVGAYRQALEAARGYTHLFGRERFFIELQRHHQRGDRRLVADLKALASHIGLGTVVTGNAHYLEPHQREVQDILTCIRLHTTLDEAGDRLRPNAEYLLRSPAEMADLFPGLSDALTNSLRIAERCTSAVEYLPRGPQLLPRFPVPEGYSAPQYLRELCEQALRERYAVNPPHALLAHELAVIEQIHLADYFLIVWDIVRFARKNGIRCQGRGSAANSLVAYLLGISPIDPLSCGLVFERFLSPERASPPDIDIDFAADRREEVIQYVYRRYGEAHAAMACTLVTFRTRLAVRDAARALGFPPALIERLAGLPLEDLSTEDETDSASSEHKEGLLSPTDAASVAEARALILSCDNGLEKPFQHLLRLAPQLEGLPRHLGIHNGGMVLAGPPLCELVPLEPAALPGRVVTQWDKDSLEASGLIKFDLLGLRMLAAIEDAVTIIAAQTGQRPDLEHLSYDDPAVYEMLCRGQTIGIFQVESRAQASLIPRFQPCSFADLVIQISLIRPGPIQAQMVHPYLRRRQGREPVTYPHPLLKDALAETLGVIVFQEQVLKVARDLAGFSPGQAELLRRALSHKRADAQVAQFRQAFIAGAAARGVDRRTAARVFAQLEAFGGYAFPKSHAAAFAVLTYQSAWLRRYHPLAFFAALLRHQPMGFYPAHVIVAEARRAGVAIRPVDVAASDLLATVEGDALRLGLATVSGLGVVGGARVVAARRSGPFRSLADFCRRTRLGRRAVEGLIWAGAFDGWGIPRRQLLWDLQAALDAPAQPPGLPLPETDDECPHFAPLSPRARLWTEVTYTGIATGAHLTALVEEQLRRHRVTSSRTLTNLRHGSKVRVGGVIVSRQRPPTAKGMVFLALEDEEGLVNVILKPHVAAAAYPALQSTFVVVEGSVQRHGQSISVLAQRVLPLTVKME